MTQSTGADAPEETTTQQDETTQEKTVTILDLCKVWDLPETAAPDLQRLMGEDGPWTQEEAKELDRRMCSDKPEDRFPGNISKDGPHGPGCECGDLTPEEAAVVEGLMDFLAPALAEALGVGRTPAEKRTGVSDPEAAILDTLGGMQPLVDRVIKIAGAIGVATSMLDKDPLRAMAAIGEESKKLRVGYKAIRDAVVQVSAFLPAVKGERARDLEGLPIWFLPANEQSGWLTTAQEESPGEEWKAVYVR
jgi:hypothetical protein